VGSLFFFMIEHFITFLLKQAFYAFILLVLLLTPVEAATCQLTLVNAGSTSFALVLYTSPSTYQRILDMPPNSTYTYTIESLAYDGTYLANSGGIHSYPNVTPITTSSVVHGGIGGTYGTGGLVVTTLATSPLASLASSPSDDQVYMGVLIAWFVCWCIVSGLTLTRRV